MHSALRCLWMIPACVVVAALPGCGDSKWTVAGGDATLPANENSAAFLDRMSSQVNVTENDATRGLLLLAGEKDAAGTFRQRIEILREKKIVGEYWDHQAERPITRGRLAYMVYRTIGIPGGIMLKAIGPTQRYCLRELQYRRMMTPGLPGTRISGLEYVAVIGRADIYMRTGKVPDLTGEVDAD